MNGGPKKNKKRAHEDDVHAAKRIHCENFLKESEIVEERKKKRNDQ